MLFTGKENAAYRTLERMGFVFCGGDEWYWPGNNVAPIDRPKKIEGLDKLFQQVRSSVSEIEDEINSIDNVLDKIEGTYT